MKRSRLLNLEHVFDSSAYTRPSQYGTARILRGDLLPLRPSLAPPSERGLIPTFETLAAGPTITNSLDRGEVMLETCPVRTSRAEIASTVAFSRNRSAMLSA